MAKGNDFEGPKTCCFLFSGFVSDPLMVLVVSIVFFVFVCFFDSGCQWVFGRLQVPFPSEGKSALGIPIKLCCPARERKFLPPKWWDLLSFGYQKEKAWGPQVAGSMFPFTNQAFEAPGIFDPNPFLFSTYYVCLT